MEVHLNFEDKIARVVSESPTEAGWLGFEFALRNPDLTKAGWRVYFYRSVSHLPGNCGVITKHPVLGPGTLAQSIKAGLPKSCCHDCCCKER